MSSFYANAIRVAKLSTMLVKSPQDEGTYAELFAVVQNLKRATESLPLGRLDDPSYGVYLKDALPLLITTKYYAVAYHNEENMEEKNVIARVWFRQDELLLHMVLEKGPRWDAYFGDNVTHNLYNKLLFNVLEVER